MKIARLGDRGAEIPVVQHDGRSFDLRAVTDRIDGTFFASGGVSRARAALAAGTLPVLDGAGSLRIGAPIDTPTKIVCIGLNYRDHAAETGAAEPSEPVVFMKDPSTLVGPYDDVLIPRGSLKTYWEVELGVVIGEQARYLPDPAASAGVIAGYVLSHDVSEREFQLERGGQWDKGKSCETFNPLGPVFVTADSIAHPQALGMRTTVNGIRRQGGSSATMIFDVNYLIWYLSNFMVLQPGDLINTGTPAGVALGLPDHPYLRAGDIVELEIDGLGIARQRMVQA